MHYYLKNITSDYLGKYVYKFRSESYEAFSILAYNKTGNTKGGSITVPLTSFFSRPRGQKVTGFEP
jgi:hypothetical protein